MKKSLIALAALSAFAAPAFAATSNVDVYGKLHMAVSFMGDQNTTAEDMQVTSSASRFGIKGTEDLGGGMKAVWQVESGLNLDEQSGTLASRNSFVGLSGNFGTVVLGNHDTPLKLIGRTVDLFGDTMADSRNISVNGGADARTKNTVAYMSPSFNGFSVAAAWANDVVGNTTNTGSTTTGAANGDGKDQSAWNLNATYTNGPVYVGLGYGAGDYHEANDVDAHWRLAGGYTFGDFKVVAQYDKASGANGAGDQDGWMLGGAYTMGPMVFKLAYMTGEIDGDPTDYNQWTVGVDYNLSKRTSVYALYADGENVAFGTGAGSTDQIGGDVDDVSIFSVGLVHNF